MSAADIAVHQHLGFGDIQSDEDLTTTVLEERPDFPDISAELLTLESWSLDGQFGRAEDILVLEARALMHAVACADEGNPRTRILLLLDCLLVALSVAKGRSRSFRLLTDIRKVYGGLVVRSFFAGFLLKSITEIGAFLDDSYDLHAHARQSHYHDMPLSNPQRQVVESPCTAGEQSMPHYLAYRKTFPEFAVSAFRSLAQGPGDVSSDQRDE